MATRAAQAVFLSYASQDSEAARRIAQALREVGIEVWFDESELRGGEAWDASIQRQIAECTLFVAIVSGHTQARREGYFRLEWRLADERMRLMAEGTPFVLPVIVDATKERDALVPKSFLGVQWTWLPHGEVPPAWVARVQRILGDVVTEKEHERVAEAPVRNGASPGTTAAMGPALVERSSATRFRRAKLMAALTVVALLALALWLALHDRQPAATVAHPPVAAHAVIQLPSEAPLAFPREQPLGVNYPSITLSADGRHLVYVASVTKKPGAAVEKVTQLYLREMHERIARPIVGTDGGYFPFFSPDGRWVGYFSNGRLYKVAVQGGTPALLGDAGKEINGADWGDDGNIYFTESGKLYRLSERGGLCSPVSAGSSAVGTSVFTHIILPGSQRVLGSFYFRQSISGDYSPISVFSLSNQEIRAVVDRGYHPRLVHPGLLLFARERGLHAVAFDPLGVKSTGDPVTVVEGVLLNAVEKAAQYAVSSNGTLVYATGGALHRATPSWVSRQGKPEKLPMEARTYGNISVSPNGLHFAILVPDVTQSIWVFDSTTGNGSRVDEPGIHVACLWTNDGTGLIIAAERNGRCGLYHKTFGHASAPTKTLYEFEHAKAMLWPHSISPDGKVLVGTRTSGSEREGFVLSMDGTRKLEPLSVPDDAWFLQFSPNGQWISFWSGRSSGGNVYVQRYPTGERIQVSFAGGEEARWSAKGDELFYRNGDTWMVVPVTTSPNFKAGEPRTLFRGPYINVPGYSYDVSPDSQRFLMLLAEDLQETPITELQVIFNWTEELKRRVPATAGKPR